MDCGSSGSRIFVYFWPRHNGNPHDLLDIKQMRDRNSQPVVKKIKPGTKWNIFHCQSLLSATEMRGQKRRGGKKATLFFRRFWIMGGIHCYPSLMKEMFRTLNRTLWGISLLSLCDLLFKESILSYLRNLCNGRHSRTCQRLPSSSAELCCCSCACEEAQGDPPLHPMHSRHEASLREVRCRRVGGPRVESAVSYIILCGSLV